MQSINFLRLFCLLAFYLREAFAGGLQIRIRVINWSCLNHPANEVDLLFLRSVSFHEGSHLGETLRSVCDLEVSRTHRMLLHTKFFRSIDIDLRFP